MITPYDASSNAVSQRRQEQHTNTRLILALRQELADTTMWLAIACAELRELRQRQEGGNA